MPSGVLRVNARPAKIKLRIKSSGAPASANVEITDVMFQPGAAVSGWLPHVTELPWVAGVTELDSGGGSVVVRWEDIEGKPLAFPPQSHVHQWSEIQDKPTAFPPAAHGHSMDDVSGLTTALAGKQAAGDYATSTALTSGLAGKANASHNHTAAQTTSGVFALARIPTMDTAHLADNSVTSAKLSAALQELLDQYGIALADLQASAQVIALGNTEDLNTVYPANGRTQTYSQALTANASLARNYPVARAGYLDAVCNAGGTMRWQTYTVYGASAYYAIYTRAWYANTWLPWRQLQFVA